MNIDEIINDRLKAVEETLKLSMDMISDAYSQCNLITYLQLLKQEKISKNISKPSTAPKI